MRKPRDNYYTDDRLTRAICARLAGLIPAPDAVVEPSAGDGAFIAAARAVWPDSSISGVDVDERCRDACVAAKADVFVAGDFLRAELGGPFGLVVGNPPYGGAEDFVRRSLEVTRDGGHVAFLLRSSFLHGQKRSMWVLKDLRWLIPIAERPSFTDDGKTDQVEYSIFVWRKSHDWPPMILPHLRWRTLPSPGARPQGELFR